MKKQCIVLAGSDEIGAFRHLKFANGAEQRFRFLKPGQFLMGSPASENEGRTYEEPQQLVTLMDGLWLADTTCTQAMWLAVMGSNPSNFTGDLNLPVDSVSWNGAREFLGKLQQLLVSTFEPVLPTEAQWEYACRAGTSTAFHFGDNINTNQVNFNGNYPYNGAAKGYSRRRTLPVKSFEGNVWGFYQMHGNVWEWCDDSLREYTAEPTSNPRGANGKEYRVVRGGSWAGGALEARSASRVEFLRDDSDNHVGFRFALKTRK